MEGKRNEEREDEKEEEKKERRKVESCAERERKTDRGRGGGFTEIIGRVVNHDGLDSGK